MSPNFLCMLPAAVAWFMFSVVAIRMYFGCCKPATISVATVEVSRPILQCSTYYIHCHSFCLWLRMPSQLFPGSCLVETKIGWMDFFVKHINEGCVLMFLELKTSCVKLTLNYSVRHQIRGTVCTNSCPPKDPKNALLP